MSNIWNLVKVLGQGSYGTVFLAVSMNGSLECVALKVVPMKYIYSLVREEIILLQFKDCPEIVQIIESDICFDGGYVALEYAAGGTLTDFITQQDDKLSVLEIKECLRMIVRGLCCIHEKGFVHGDLKPDNILVFPKDYGKVKLKIADFGLSKALYECEEVVISTNAKPRFIGTPKYMSPESIVFGKISTSLDIWSLGCILIEMVSGKQVWDDCKSLEELVKKVVNQADVPNIPEELCKEGRDFLSRCIDPNFERRWTADMLLKHPYLKEEHNIDEVEHNIDEVAYNSPALLNIKRFKEEDAIGNHLDQIDFEEKYLDKRLYFRKKSLL